MPHTPDHFDLTGDAVPIAPEDRLDQFQLRGAQTGAAFQQLFDPTLSGRQEDFASQIDKNRRARGLRGAAALQAGQQERTRFESDNRSAALDFLRQQFGAQAGIPFGIGPGGDPGIAAPGFERTSGGAAADTAGFQALLGEIFGLQTLAAESPNAFNQTIEDAQRASKSGTGFRGAFESLFPGADASTFDILDPIGAGNRRIGQFNEILPGLIEQAGAKGFGNQNRDIVGFGEGGVGGIGIRATRELIEQLGFDPSFVDTRGIGSLNDGDLSSRFGQLFGDKFFGGLEGIQIGAEARLDPTTQAGGINSRVGQDLITGNTRNQGELGEFFTFSGDTPEATARLLANLNNIAPQLGGINKREVGGLAESKELAAIRRIVGDIDNIRDFQSRVNAPLSNADLFTRLEQRRTELSQPRFRTERTIAPLSGNVREFQVLDPVDESERLRRLATIDAQFNAADRFRLDQLSPFRLR
jgi:hypothetical protein